jgi:hydrogenase maturation protease
MPLDDEPGTVALIEAALDHSKPAEIETHGMDPVRVLRLARELGALPDNVFVVGCQPQTVIAPDADEVLVELSAPVQAAARQAALLVRKVVDELVQDEHEGGEAK